MITGHLALNIIEQLLNSYTSLTATSTGISVVEFRSHFGKAAEIFSCRLRKQLSAVDFISGVKKFCLAILHYTVACNIMYQK